MNSEPTVDKPDQKPETKAGPVTEETPQETLPDVSFKGVPSLRALFDAPASLSGARITRLLGPWHLHQAALQLKLEGTSTQNWQKTYDVLAMYFRETGPNPLVCNCTPELMPKGLRWMHADNKEPVTVFIHNSLNTEQRKDIVVALALLQAETENLKFELVEEDNRPVDIFIDKGVIDGAGRTLGVTRFTDVGNDLNNNFAVELYIRFDEAERWDITGFFLAVAIHELGHGVGVEHFDADLDNMNSRLRRIFIEIQPWFRGALHERYLQRASVAS